MAEPKMVTVGENVCFWLVYGQPYLATVDVVYEQINAAGGATVDLTYAGIHKAFHVPYDPSGQPHAYCRADDSGWAGSLPKDQPAAKTEAPEEPVVKTVATATSKRTEPKS